MATHPTHAGASPRLIISWEELERIVGASNVQRIREARKPIHTIWAVSEYPDPAPEAANLPTTEALQEELDALRQEATIHALSVVKPPAPRPFDARD